ncbi:hypothetical protein V4C29_23995 [Bacillus cereus]|uniref:hypothetical protein n=1 Tax=Bacillus cereus TaxID=1396 RepID=UPI002FE4848D|nr:hypothetical protein [Bacillus cereus]
MTGYYITDEDYKRAEAFGISNKLLSDRVYIYRWNKEKAITTPVRKTKNRGWKEFKQIALENGVSERTFRRRRQEGWDAVIAATTPPKTRKEVLQLSLDARRAKRPFTEEQIKQAQQNGINYSTLLKRVKACKWDKKEAIETPVLTPQEVAKRANADNDFYRNGKKLNLRKKA